MLEHGPLEEDGTDHGQNELAGGGPRQENATGRGEAPERRDAAAVNARRPHQASANRTRHPERSGMPPLLLSSPSGMRRNYHESPLPETKDCGIRIRHSGSRERFVRTPPRW